MIDSISHVHCELFHKLGQRLKIVLDSPGVMLYP